MIPEYFRPRYSNLSINPVSSVEFNRTLPLLVLRMAVSPRVLSIEERAQWSICGRFDAPPVTHTLAKNPVQQVPTYLVLVFRSSFSPVPFPSRARTSRLPTEWARFLFRDRFAGPQVVLSGSTVVWYHSFWLLDRLIRYDRYEKCPLI